MLVGMAKQKGHWIMLLDLIISWTNEQMDSGCHEGSNHGMIYKALEVIWIFLVGRMGDGMKVLQEVKEIRKKNYSDNLIVWIFSPVYQGT